MSYARIIHEKEFCTHEILTKNNLGLRGTQEKKFWIHETPKGREILHPRNTHEKKISGP